MKSIVVGTAGHIDHGKTLLVKALTGTDADRWEQEKRRGITMDIGFAKLDLPEAVIHFVDLPGHESFVRNMVAGATGIDVCLLVVAADESIMQQTREHVEILKLLGVKRGVVALNKIDLVDEETRELVRMEVEEFLEAQGFGEMKVHAVSAKTGEGVPELIEALSEAAGESLRSGEPRPFRMPIDRVFTVKGFGTVVTGTCIDGGVSVGESVEIYPDGAKSRVRGLQVFGETVEEVSAGMRVAMNIPDLAPYDLERGDLAGEPGALWPARFLDVKLEMLVSALHPLKHGLSCRLHVHTSETNAHVILEGRKTLAPGEEDICQLVLEAPVAAWPGDRFILRLPSPVRTIGGGEVLLPAWRRARWRRRRDRSVAEALRAGAVLEAMLKEAGPTGLTPEEVRGRLGFGAAEIPKVSSLVAWGEGTWLLDAGEAERWLERTASWLKERIAKAPSNWVSGRELVERWKVVLGEKKGEAMLKAAAQAGRIEMEGDRIKPAGHRVALNEEQKRAWDRIVEALDDDGWSFGSVEELKEEFGAVSGEVLPLMVEDGLLIRFGGRFFCTASTLERLKALLTEWKQREEEFSIPDFKDRLGTTRKYAMPLLAYLDDLKWTRRTETGRKILLPLGEKGTG